MAWACSSPLRIRSISTTKRSETPERGSSAGYRPSATKRVCSMGSPVDSTAAEMDRVLSALKKRIFLMHNVHETAPVVFETRWTLSYLRGPLSREDIKG